MKKSAVSVTLLLLVLLALPILADNKDPIIIVEPTNDCTYCSKPNCGCTAPPPGYYLSYSCACGSGPGSTCDQNCSYNPL